jgi:serine/threonine protein kinase
MPIKVRCPNPECGREGAVPEQGLGQSIRCRHCNTRFTAKAPGTLATSPSAPPPAAFAVGPQAIGRYQIREELGSGAFGTVYRAYDPQLEREVALKTLRPEVLTSPQAVKRFRREARVAANLHHPHIVPVHDAGQDGQVHFLVTGFIRGRTLSSSIPDNGMDTSRAVSLGVQLAEALAYAHQNGVLHRDVKPANILLDDRDTLYLMDFGLAGWTESANSRLTKIGTLMGTPAYMAPEQACGEIASMGPAADLYAAGVVLYEMLTGKVPFDGPVEAVIFAVIHTKPPSPLVLRPGLDPQLETICLKAMAKKAGERHASGRELASVLQGWLQTQASSPSMPDNPPQRNRRMSPATMERATPRVPQEGVRETQRKGIKAEESGAAGAATAPGGSPTKHPTGLRNGFQRPTKAPEPVPSTRETPPSKSPPSAPWGKKDGKARSVSAKTVIAAVAVLVVLLAGLAVLLSTRPRDGEERKGNAGKVAGQDGREVPVVRRNDGAKGKGDVGGEGADGKELPKVITNSLGLKLVLIPVGKFWMGAPEGEGAGNEGPQHEVEITKKFYLGVTEVTQGQFKKVMGYNPSYFSTDGNAKDWVMYEHGPAGGKEKVKDLDGRDDLPVENVSWDEAQAFLEKLSALGEEKTIGLKYRLPTEAEWEYSCRSGTVKQAYHFGSSFSSTQANGDGSVGRTCKVGLYPANAFGLKDMHGNVWEWCSDRYADAYDVNSPARDPSGPSEGPTGTFRGGSWNNIARECTSTTRGCVRHLPGYRNWDLGFRVAAVPVAQ